MKVEINLGDILLCRKTYVKHILNKNEDVPILTFGKRYKVIGFYAWGGVRENNLTIIDDSDKKTNFRDNEIDQYFVVGKRMRKLKIRVLNKKQWVSERKRI